MTTTTEVRKGMRIITKHAVDRFPDFIVPKGRTGTVTMLGEREVWVKFDEPIKGAEEWQNHVYWSDDLGRIDGSEQREEVLKKRLRFFFQDVEVIHDGRTRGTRDGGAYGGGRFS